LSLSPSPSVSLFEQDAVSARGEAIEIKI